MHAAATHLCNPHRCHLYRCFNAPPRSSSAPGAPMAWLDVMPYMLGHFSTVKEAVAWATSDEVQVRGLQHTSLVQQGQYGRSGGG